MLPSQIRRTSGGVERSPDFLGEQVGRMLSRFWDEVEPYGAYGAYPVDIHEDQDHIYIEAEMPGFTKDEVNVTLENGVLTLSGERKVEEHKGETHLSERRYTRVSRRFSLPNTVDESNVEARLHDGVLHLTLNKREEVKPRKIDVH